MNYETVKKALDEMFSDTSISKEECLSGMNALSDEISTMADCLEMDIENEKD